MARPVSVLVVGSPSSRHNVREILEGEGLHVIGEATLPADIVGDAQPDVVLLLDDEQVDEIVDGWHGRELPALVVLTRDGRLAQDLAVRNPQGWAVVPPESGGAEVAAAILAAANGFAVRPAGLHEDGTDEEEYGPIETLTPREREVLELLSQGLPNKAIAARLRISDHTVKFHLSSIFSKLGVTTRTEAVRRGVRAGLVNL